MSKNNNPFMVRAEIRRQLTAEDWLMLEHFSMTETIDFIMTTYYTYNSKRAYAVDSTTGNSLILSKRKISVILGSRASWIQIIPPLIDYDSLTDDIAVILNLIDTVIAKIDD